MFDSRVIHDAAHSSRRTSRELRHENVIFWVWLNLARALGSGPRGWRFDPPTQTTRGFDYLR